MPNLLCLHNPKYKHDCRSQTRPRFTLYAIFCAFGEPDTSLFLFIGGGKQTAFHCISLGYYLPLVHQICQGFLTLFLLTGGDALLSLDCFGLLCVLGGSDMSGFSWPIFC